MAAAMPFLLALAAPGGDAASDPWRGPGRFCGYATAIDLIDGETLTPGDGAVEVAEYRWSGAFGSVDVSEINWAVAPRHAGREVESTQRRHVYRKRDAGHWRYTLWDGGKLVARISGTAFDGSIRDLGLMRRISLVDHAGANAPDCKFRIYYAG
jgi:hypothetical protein